MNYSSVKEKININFIFLFILSLYYLIPYFFVGQLIVSPHDTLDGPIVYNHIIGKIYRGDHQSINLLIGGEIKWYFLRAIFQPLTLLYGLFDSETAFWLNHIVIKLTCYICLLSSPNHILLPHMCDRHLDI